MWNQRQGQCASRAPCRRGFVHGICDVCYRDGHRSCDVHPEVKGRGKKGDKGKGKGHKGKKGDKNRDAPRADAAER